MTDVVSILMSPLFDFIDLALDSPLAALTALAMVALLVLALLR